MKHCLIAVCALFAVGTHADTIHLTSGQKITGKTTSYWNMQFEVVAKDGEVRRCPIGQIQKAEFEDATVTLDTRSRGKLSGQLVGFENAAFKIKNDKGATEEIPVSFVKEASFGAGSGGESAADVAQVNGSDLTKHLAAGKVTIVDFYADWCGPCRRIGPVLESMAKSDPDVVLRKVNVDKNQQLAAKYGVRGIPHIMIYDRAGKAVGTVVGANESAVKDHVAKAKGSSK